MLLQTAEFTVDAVGNPEPVTVTRRCNRVLVREQSDAASGEFWVYPVDRDGNALAGATPAKYAAGTVKEFRPRDGYQFYPGQTIARIAAATGSLILSREEYGQSDDAS